MYCVFIYVLIVYTDRPYSLQYTIKHLYVHMCTYCHVSQRIIFSAQT